MADRIDELYKEYLYEQLDIIFNDSGNKQDNKLAWSMIKRQYNKLPIKFYEGIAKLWSNQDSVFINPQREVIGVNAYNNYQIWDYQFGYARVKKNNKYNYINKKGNLISNKWFNFAEDFMGDYAIVLDDNCGYYLINKKGEPINDDRYDFIINTNAGLLDARLNEKHILLKLNGTPLNGVEYDEIGGFSYGYAIVTKDNKYGFVSIYGKLYENKWFTKKQLQEWYHRNQKTQPSIHYFEETVYNEGFAIANLLNKVVFIDKYHNPLFGKEFKKARLFSEGYAVVSDDGKSYYYIRQDGKPLNKDKYIEAYDFKNGIARVKLEKDNKYSYIDSNGKYLYNCGFYKAGDFVLGNGRFAQVEEDLIDTNGNIIFQTKFLSEPHLSVNEISSNFIDIIDTREKVIIRHKLLYNRYYDEHKVMKHKSKYIVYSSKKGTREYEVKYEPVAIYDRYTLCLNNKKLILFDLFKKSYKELGTISEIEYDRNFIYDNKNDKIYFLYFDQMNDITEYYKKNLLFKNKISVKKNVRFYTDYVFRERYEQEIQKLATPPVILDSPEEKIIVPKIDISIVKEENEDIVKELEALDKCSTAEELSIKELYEAKEGELIEDKLKRLEKYEELNNENVRIKVDNLFINVGDHKEIKPICLAKGLLKHIDLSYHDFHNVKMSGIDFRGCNIILKPQDAYNKDLSNSNFEGIYIDPFMDFTGINIKGCKFGNDNYPKTIYRGSSFFPLAKYDETTTFDGIPFTEIYGECKYEEKDINRRV